MTNRKVFTVKSSMIRKGELMFKNFISIGVYTTRKRAVAKIYEAYLINKGKGMVEARFVQNHFDYECFSTDGELCQIRAIIEEFELNK